MSKDSLIDMLRNAPEDVRIPEWIIENIHRNGKREANMLHIDGADGKRLYCVREWVYWVSGSQASDQTPAWANLRRAIKKEIARDIKDGKAAETTTIEGLLNLQPLEVITSGGRQIMEFTDEEGLYQITQRISDRSKVARDVKSFLAQSGVFMGAAYNNPEAAAESLDRFAYNREYQKLIDEGFAPEEAEQWLSVRGQQKRGRRKITAIWSERGINKPKDFADLTNQIHHVALGRTATHHKRELAVKDTPRNYVSAADNTTLQVTELTSGLLHEHRESFGKPELSEDIDDVRPIIDAARPEIQRVFSQKPRRLSSGGKIRLNSSQQIKS